MLIQLVIIPYRMAFADNQSSDVKDNSEKVTIEFSSNIVTFIVANPNTELEKRITNRLAEYVSNVLHKRVSIVEDIQLVPTGKPAIILLTGKNTFGVSVSAGSPESFILETKVVKGHPLVIAAGNTELGLKRAVQRLILKSEQREPGLVVPDIHLSESPWMSKREWAVCPWSPEFVRRAFVNPDVDKKLNIWLYSDQQTADYVEMFDWFGFSGCQLMETSANYGNMGSPEAFLDKQKRLAQNIRKNGQHVTYWVWAAQFDDYGWNDKSVTYAPAPGKSAFEDTKVRTTFEKYYNHYAQMAPYVDLLIAHFYDPGMLENREDVFSYLGLLQNKFKEKNPKIQFGVDFWAAESPSDYMQQLIDHGFSNSLLLQMSLPNVYKPGEREALHEAAKQKKIKMGMWGWYMTEYESDQLPMMHVNTKALKGFYQSIRNGANKIHPINYWSEMEAYHLNNIFTMYSAGQLLWNPDRDPDEILHEIAEGIWGPRNGTLVFDALSLIQDVRTGPNWNTFWWTTPEYRLGTDNPEGDYQRAEKCITVFENMETDTSFVPKFPLPFPPATFVELTLPHLRQIKAYAEFRIKVNKIKEAAQKGFSKEELTRMANEAWKPVPEYNTWIGAFGQTEATMQEETMFKLAKDLDLTITTPGSLRFRDANRLLQLLQNNQRQLTTPLQFNDESHPNIRGEFHWSPEKFADRINMLIEKGCVEKTADGKYQLVNWVIYCR